VGKKSTAKATKYDYETFVSSTLFSGIDRDLLSTLLDPNKQYSQLEVEKKLKIEKKRMVK